MIPPKKKALERAGTNSVDAALVGTVRQSVDVRCAPRVGTLVEKPGVRPGFFF
jgi:hypothetical protein